jgi:urease accessory protein
MRFLYCALAIVLSVPALAHTGLGDTHGFAHGFIHPTSGVDHVLAMVAVGIFAAQLGGRALWLVPLTFVAMMAIAGSIGMAGIAIPCIEIGIGLSVVGLGAAIAFGLSIPVLAAMSLVGLFAMFHGHAHGAEMPETASGIAYAAGFVAATVLLHALGVGLGRAIAMLGQSRGRRVAEAGGSAMAVLGVAILARVV